MRSPVPAPPWVEVRNPRRAPPIGLVPCSGGRSRGLRNARAGRCRWPLAHRPALQNRKTVAEPTRARREVAPARLLHQVRGLGPLGARRTARQVCRRGAGEPGVQGLKVPPFSEFGTPVEIVRFFGGKRGFEDAVQGLARMLYAQ